MKESKPMSEELKRAFEEYARGLIESNKRLDKIIVKTKIADVIIIASIAIAATAIILPIIFMILGE